MRGWDGEDLGGVHVDGQGVVGLFVKEETVMMDFGTTRI